VGGRFAENIGMNPDGKREPETAASGDSWQQVAKAVRQTTVPDTLRWRSAVKSLWRKGEGTAPTDLGFGAGLGGWRKVT
jgi:hypothetical protein